MFITHVQYTVKAEYAAHNRANVADVMRALQETGNTDIDYSVFIKEDGQSFIHLVQSTDDAGLVLRTLPEFKKFQEELKASEPIVSPQVSKPTLVASSLTAVARAV